MADDTITIRRKGIVSLGYRLPSGCTLKVSYLQQNEKQAGEGESAGEMTVIDAAGPDETASSPPYLSIPEVGMLKVRVFIAPDETSVRLTIQVEGFVSKVKTWRTGHGVVNRDFSYDVDIRFEE